MRGRVQTGDGNDMSDKVWSGDLHAAALDSELDIKVKLTDIETTLKQFEALRTDDIIYIKQADDARVYVNDVPVFDADVGSNGTNMAIKLPRLYPPINKLNRLIQRELAMAETERQKQLKIKRMPKK